MMTPTQTRRQLAATIAARCEDAYSADRYASWTGCADALLKLGLDDLAVEAVLRSKWTRWAADLSSAQYGKVPVNALIRFVTNEAHWPQQVADLRLETFGREEGGINGDKNTTTR